MMGFGFVQTSRTPALVSLLLLSTLSLVHAHDCIHDKIQTEAPEPQHVNYANHPWEPKNGEKRRLLNGATAPIRIHADFSVLEQDWSGRTSDINGVKKAIGAVTRYLNRLLKVIPVNGPLRIAQSCPSFWTSGAAAGKCARDPTSAASCQSCNGSPLITIPNAHLDTLNVYTSSNVVTNTYPGGAGIPNADLVIYVAAKNCNCQGPSAWAGSCRSDQFGRPIAGAVNICSINVNNWESSVMLLLHEIGHIFYMSGGLFNSYRDPSGNKYTNPTMDIGSQPFLVTPNVQAVARSHFACSTLQGAPLENNGNSAGSHWEKQHLFSEVLNPSLSGQNFMSEFSIAAMLDSGWYDVQLTNADLFQFGLNAGCGFPTSNQCSAYPDFFCTNTGTSNCAYNYKTIGPCSGSSSSYTSCNTNGKWSNFLPCTDVNQAQSSQNGGKGGINSRCAVISGGSWPNTASCYPMQCNSYNAGTRKYASVTLTVGTKSITCLRSEIGQQKNLNTGSGDPFTGTLTCPNFDTFCVGSNPFQCVNGKAVGNTCFCQAGWKGALCDVQDNAVWTPPVTLPTVAPPPTTRQPTSNPATSQPTSACGNPSGAWSCWYTNYLQDCYMAANIGNYATLIAGGFSNPNLMVKYCLTGQSPYNGWTQIKVWSSSSCGNPSWSRSTAVANAPNGCATGQAGTSVNPVGTEGANTGEGAAGKEALSGGAIAGIVISATLVLVCCVVGVVYCMRQRTKATNGYAIMAD